MPHMSCLLTARDFRAGAKVFRDSRRLSCRNQVRHDLIPGGSRAEARYSNEHISYVQHYPRKARLLLSFRELRDA